MAMATTLGVTKMEPKRPDQEVDYIEARAA